MSWTSPENAVLNNGSQMINTMINNEIISLSFRNYCYVLCIMYCVTYYVLCVMHVVYTLRYQFKCITIYSLIIIQYYTNIILM
jgi:hypothetical protein